MQYWGMTLIMMETHKKKALRNLFPTPTFTNILLFKVQLHCHGSSSFISGMTQVNSVTYP